MPLPSVTILDAEFDSGGELYGAILHALGRANEQVLAQGLPNDGLYNFQESLSKSAEDGVVSIGDVVTAINNIEDSNQRNALLAQLVGSDYQGLLGVDGKLAMKPGNQVDIGIATTFTNNMLYNLDHPDSIYMSDFEAQILEKKVEEYKSYIESEGVDRAFNEAMRTNNTEAIEFLFAQKYIKTIDIDKVNRVISEGTAQEVVSLLEGIKPEFLNDAQMSTIIKRNLGESYQYSSLNEYIAAQYSDKLSVNSINEIIKSGDNGAILQLAIVAEDLHEAAVDAILKTGDRDIINAVLEDQPKLAKKVAQMAVANGEFNADMAFAATFTYNSYYEQFEYREDGLSKREIKDLMLAATKAGNSEMMGMYVASNDNDMDVLKAIFEHRDSLNDNEKNVLLHKLINKNVGFDINISLDKVPAAFDEAVELESKGIDMSSVLELLMHNEGGKAGRNDILTDDQIIASIVKEGREEVAIEFARAFLAEGRLDMVAKMLEARKDDAVFLELIGGLEVEPNGDLLGKISDAYSPESKKWKSEDSTLGSAVSVSELFESGVLTDANMDKIQIDSNVQTQFSNEKHSSFKLK